MSTSTSTPRTYGPTKLRGRIAAGQIWQSTQTRDQGRRVRIESKRGDRIKLAPLDVDHVHSSVSELTLRKVYALVAFRLTDHNGRPVGPLETHGAVLKRRMSLWATKADRRLGVMLDGHGLVHPAVSGYDAFNARKPR